MCGSCQNRRRMSRPEKRTWNRFTVEHASRTAATIGMVFSIVFLLTKLGFTILPINNQNQGSR